MKKKQLTKRMAAVLLAAVMAFSTVGEGETLMAAEPITVNTEAVENEDAVTETMEKEESETTEAENLENTDSEETEVTELTESTELTENTEEDSLKMSAADGTVISFGDLVQENIQLNYKRNFNIIYVCILHEIYTFDLIKNEWNVTKMDEEIFNTISINSCNEVKCI